MVVQDSSLSLSSCSFQLHHHAPPIFISNRDTTNPTPTFIHLANCSLLFPLHFRPSFVETTLSPPSSQIGIAFTSSSLASFATTTGDGPLLTFQSPATVLRAFPVIYCTFSGINVRNGTSPFQPRYTLDSRFSQRLVGCSVEQSSNHLSGTLNRDFNFGGSIISSNNTFVSCHTRGPQRTLSNAEIIKQNIKPGQSDHVRIEYTTSNATKSDTIIFTSCHFQDLSTTLPGGAIFFNSILSNIHVKHCKFVRLTAYSGAAFVTTGSADQTPRDLKVSDCVFQEGRATVDTGSSFYAYSGHALDVSDCLITQCQANYSTVAVLGRQTASFSNSVIEHNEGGRTGGIRLILVGNMDFSMNSVIFDDNVGLGIHSPEFSQDIDMNSGEFSITMDKEHVQYCWTTSLRPNCWDYEKNSFTDSKLFGPVLWSIECTGWNEIDARKGVMGVTGLFWKEEGIYTVVVRDDNNVTFSFEMALGEDHSGINSDIPIGGPDEMKGETLYHLVTIGGSSSQSKTRTGRNSEESDEPNEIFDSSTLSIRRDWSYYLYTDASTADNLETFTFTTPTQPPHVHSIEASLDETLDYVVFSLTTTNVKDGTYTLVLKDGSAQVQIETTIVESRGSVTVLARNVSGLAKVKYGTIFDLGSFSNSEVSTTYTPISVSTPQAPPRIVSVWATSGSDSIDLHWTSFGLSPSTSYSVFLSSTSTPSGVAAHSRTLEIVTDDSGDVIDSSAQLFPFDSHKELEYGTVYSVQKVEETLTSTRIASDAMTITTPSEPSRLTKLTLSSYDTLEKTANFVIEGRSMPTNRKLTLSLTSSSPSTVRTIVVEFTTSTVGSGSGILFSENSEEIELDYDTTYELTNVVDESRAEVLFVGGQTIKTISKPGRVLRVENVEFGKDLNTTTIALEGHWMETGEFAMEVENTADSSDRPVLTASFDSENAGTSTAWLYPTAELKFGTHYRIVRLEKKIGKSRNVHVDSNLEFSIVPTPSRLTGLMQNSPEDEEKELRLSLTGIGMTNGPFRIELSPAGSLTATFSDGTSGSSTAILFSTNPEVSRLNYSTRYEVVGVTDSSSAPVLYDSGLSFVTGSEPTRLVGISSSLRFNPSQTTLLIPVSGRELDTSKEYVVEVKDSISPIALSNLSMSFLSSEWIVSGTIFGDSVDILFSHSYSVNGFFVSGSSSPRYFEPISFTVPSEPSRLTKLTLFSYDALEKTVNFHVEGRSMPTNKELILSLTSSSPSTARTIVVEFTTSTAGSGSGILFSENEEEIELDYETTYELTKVEDEKKEEVLFVGGQTISTISEPGRVLRVGEVEYSGDMNTTTITLEGHWMETGDFTMEVENTADSSDRPVLTASFASENAGTSTASLYPTVELKYGTRYRIVSLEKKVGNSRKVHVESSVEFSIDPKPARLTGLTQNSRSNEEKELRLSLTGIGMTNGPFTVQLSPSGSLTATFTDGTSGSSTAILFSTNPEVSRLNYSTRYEVVGVIDSSSAPVLYDSGLSFQTGAEPTRLVGISSSLRFNPSQTTLLIPVSGRELDTSLEYVVEVKDSISPFALSNLSMSFSSSEWIVSGTIFGDSVDILPSHSYSVNGFFVSGSSSPLFFEPISFTVPDPPVIDSISASFSSEMNTSIILSVVGSNLPKGSTFVVHLVNSPLLIPITFHTDTSGSSSPISLIHQPGLSFETTYEVRKICSADDSAVEIPINSKTFGPFSAPLAWFVAGGGSGDVERCGSLTLPCGWVSVGWTAGLTKTPDSTILVVSLLRQTQFGDRMAIGSGTLTLNSQTGQHRLVIASLPASTGGGDGMIETRDGTVELDSLILSLPSSPSSPSFVVCGSGTFTCHSLRIESGVVGMGLVSLNKGTISIDTLEMTGVHFTSTVSLVTAVSNSNEINLHVSDCVVRNTTTDTSLILFSSANDASLFSLANCAFLNTHCIGTSADLSLSSLISVTTAQPSLTLSDCVFEQCRPESILHSQTGSVIRIVLKSATTPCSVTLLSCLLIDSSMDGRTGLGGVEIEGGSQTVIVHLMSSWMEEMEQTSIPFARSPLSVPLLSHSRLRRFSSSSTQAVAVQVRSQHLPIVKRSGTVFVGCGLKIAKQSNS